MSRPSFFWRLRLGQCSRWEQALVGGCAGLGCGLLVAGAMILSSGERRRPETLTIPEAALLFGAMGAGFGMIVGARASVNPIMPDASELLPELPEEPARDGIVAFVWPAEHSSAESLRALGRELEAWRAGKPHVTRITGLERLLAGRYPMPDGPTPYVEDPEGELMPCPCDTPEGLGIEYRRMSIVEPWLNCPALVWAVEGQSSDGAIASLRRAIPPDLVTGIGYSFW